jgi:cytochrome P450
LPQGHLDLTDGFGRLVPAFFVADYFGIAGPGPDALMSWARDIFTDGFANVLGIPLLSRRAMKASDAFRAHLDGVIAAARTERAGDTGRDDVLGRLLAMQASGESAVSDVWIRDTLLWCVAGMIDNVNTAVCSATDYLLGHATARQGATDAARAQDEERLGAHVLEALRFRTPTPVVTRVTTQAHTLSAGTPHETTIPPGTLTFAGLGAAMMDASAIESPREFRLDRPASHYLHFGTGLHRCLGAHIAMAMVTTMLARVLTLPGLRRGRGATGRLRVVGAFPKTFVVDFDPA